MEDKTNSTFNNMGCLWYTAPRLQTTNQNPQTANLVGARESGLISHMKIILTQNVFCGPASKVSFNLPKMLER